jgi:putative membrane protein
MNCKIRNITFAGALVAAVILAAGPAAVAQTGRMPQSQYPAGQNPIPGDPNATGMSDATAVNTVSDSDFAKQAAEGGMAEVKLGQLAQDKGTSEAVKEFGKKMVDDHSQANDKLTTIASQENVKIPITLNKHDQATYDKLSKLSGEAFDRAYARDMVKDHQDDIAAFQQEARNGRDNGIKSFASETLPTLQEHLKMAREMMKSVSASNGAKNGPGNSH